MPFTNITVSGRKLLDPAYPDALETLGDRLRTRRLDLGLFQKEVAKHIGVTTDTITNWELNRTEPEVRYLPTIIDFLGYVPFPVGETFPERLKAYRLMQGLSQEKFARELGIDETTLWKWENGKSSPSIVLRGRIESHIFRVYGLRLRSIACVCHFPLT